jgi:hypothetical protein
VAAISRECFAACGRARGYEQPNPDCQQRPGACSCICHESNASAGRW